MSLSEEAAESVHNPQVRRPDRQRDHHERDFTRRKCVEAADHLGEDAWHECFAAAPLGLLLVAPNGRIMRANPALLAMLGRGAEDLLGRKLAEFCADPRVLVNLLIRLARKETLKDNRLRLLRKNRSPLDVLIDANGFWKNGRMAQSYWYVRDVTGRTELQKEILAIGERIQGRIGQDLHEVLCQQLTGIEFLTQALKSRLAAGDQVETSRAEEIARLTRQAITYARELSLGISPLELEPEGLSRALKNLAACADKPFKIDCRFHCRSSVAFADPETRIQLYRIAQEAVDNAIKHGRAKHIEIGLEVKKGQTILIVRDDGAGLPLNPRKRKVFGLRIMACRASVLGGSLVVRRRKSGGTSLVCSIPIAPSQPARQQ
jgi:two-component system, LuxR family, sensor kinase FixL